MFTREHADARDNDRELRREIDPLIDGLSGQGKIELAMRLMMEGVREFAAGAIGRDTPARELPPTIDGSSQRKRDEGSSEGST